jgi:hypothetical protein
MSLLTGNQTVLGAATYVSLTGPRDSTGGCRSNVADKLGVSLSQFASMVHIVNHPGMNKRPIRGRSSETSVSPHHS